MKSLELSTRSAQMSPGGKKVSGSVSGGMEEIADTAIPAVAETFLRAKLPFW